MFSPVTCTWLYWELQLEISGHLHLQGGGFGQLWDHMGLLCFQLYLLHPTPPQFITRDAQIVATLWSGALCSLWIASVSLGDDGGRTVGRNKPGAGIFICAHRRHLTSSSHLSVMLMCSLLPSYVCVWVCMHVEARSGHQEFSQSFKASHWTEQLSSVSEQLS